MMENPYQAPSSEEPPPFPGPVVGELKNPRMLGLASLFFYALSTLGEIAEHFQRSFAAGVAMANLDAHDTYYVVADVPGPFEWLMLGAAVPAAVFFFMWKYRVAVNAWILNPPVMKISPAMCVGYYFIPFWNFVMPCKAMAGIARASYGSTEGVALWWTTQMISMIGGLTVGAMLADQPPHAPPGRVEHLYLIVSIVTFVCAWQIVMKISRAQAARCAA